MDGDGDWREPDRSTALARTWTSRWTATAIGASQTGVKGARSHLDKPMDGDGDWREPDRGQGRSLAPGQRDARTAAIGASQTGQGRSLVLASL